MVFVVLLLPLYMAWHMERHAKAKWVASKQQQQQPGGLSTDTVAAAGDAGTPGDVAEGSSYNSDQQQQLLQPGCADLQSFPEPVSNGVLPPMPGLLRHLRLMLAVSVASGQAVVPTLCIAPNLQAYLRQQVVYYEY
jgi:hypothetical protein